MLQLPRLRPPPNSSIVVPMLSLESIHQVAVHSSDLDRSIAFYRDQLGATFIAKFDPPGLAFFRFGATRLLLEKNAHPATIYFRVDDIVAAVEALRARDVPFDTEPRAIHRDDAGQFGPAGAEEWMAFFHDPDGNVLALASQVVGS
jgi:catechol 2,3-dioxygenase-like lactoylglutathione lyase family enzyme